MKVIIDTNSLLSLVRYYLPFDKENLLFNFIKEKIEIFKSFVFGEIFINSIEGNTVLSVQEKKDLEFTIGTSTIVYEVKNDEIHLITGWNGSRK